MINKDTWLSFHFEVRQEVLVSDILKTLKTNLGRTVEISEIGYIEVEGTDINVGLVESQQKVVLKGFLGDPLVPEYASSVALWGNGGDTLLQEVNSSCYKVEEGLC